MQDHLAALICRKAEASAILNSEMAFAEGWEQWWVVLENLASLKAPGQQLAPATMKDGSEHWLS